MLAASARGIDAEFSPFRRCLAAYRADEVIE
jgi:hypothetical protein